MTRVHSAVISAGGCCHLEHLGGFLCEWGEVGFRAQLSPHLSLHWASCGISQCSQGCWEMLGEVGSLVLLVASLSMFWKPPGFHWQHLGVNRISLGDVLCSSYPPTPPLAKSSHRHSPPPPCTWNPLLLSEKCLFIAGGGGSQLEPKSLGCNCGP